MRYKQIYTSLFVLFALLIGWVRLQADDNIFLPVVMSSGSTVATATTTPITTPFVITTTPTATASPTSTVQSTPTVTATSTPTSIVQPTPTVMATSTLTSTVDATSAVVSAAQAFLATLSDAQRISVSFAFSDTTQRAKWSNLPLPIFSRNGMKVADMTTAQNTALMAVLSATLSAKGYQQVVDVMNGDEVLKNQGSGGLQFGKGLYWVSFLGQPSTTTPWMFQFGGHHLAINVTIVGSHITLAPSLPAAQPVNYTLDGRTVRQLGTATDKAFALLNALTSTQQTQAIIGNSVMDLVLGPGQDGKIIQSEGIQGSALSAEQQTMLLDLAAEWVQILNDEDAAVKMAELKANIANTWFAWSGPTTAGSAAYIRITGPTVFIEYSPQSMGGDATNHLHTIYRDPTNDYGAAWTD